MIEEEIDYVLSAVSEKNTLRSNFCYLGRSDNTHYVYYKFNGNGGPEIFFAIVRIRYNDRYIEEIHRLSKRDFYSINWFNKSILEFKKFINLPHIKEKLLTIELLS